MMVAGILSLFAAVTLSSILCEQASAAAYEQLPLPSGTFAEVGEEVQLGGASGMAANSSGVGGVPAGTVYVATKAPPEVTFQIARFSPLPDGGLKFSEAWEVNPTGGPYQRCGPDVEDPKTKEHVACVPRPVGSAKDIDVDVDQKTGNVYTFSTTGVPVGAATIVEYDALGDEIARFGLKAVPGETTALSPSKIHDSPYPGGIAVGPGGLVYVFDVNVPDDFYHRVMMFQPKPGNPTEYEYSGQSHDIGAGVLGASEYPTAPVTDADGNVYVIGGEEFIEEYEPAQPDSAICIFGFKKGGLTAIAVNRVLGEVFFYTYKDRLIHQLASCEAGTFNEVGTVSVAPPRDNLYALTVDPVRKVPPSRPAGVLYGAAPGPVSGLGKGEPGKTSLGYIVAPVAEHPPSVESAWVSGVMSTTAELHARIDPNGVETRYVFQYITDTAFEELGGFLGASEAPVGGAVLGSSQSPLDAAALLSGLSPNTEYRYRVLSKNCLEVEEGSVCEDVSAAQSFRTDEARPAGPPDHRGYELVSPPEKQGGQVLPAEPATKSCGIIECKPGIFWERFPMQSSPDGKAVVFEGMPFSTQGAAIENEYVARRDEGAGWRTTTLSPFLQGAGVSQGYKAFDAALSEGVLYQIDPALSPLAPPGYANLYLQPTVSLAPLSPLMEEAPPNRSPGFSGSNNFSIRYVAASADLSRIFFEANDALTPETPVAPAASDGGVGKNNLYEWNDGQLRLANVLPGNAEAIPGASWGAGNAHAISDDGSRAFWSFSGQVYVREDAEITKAVSSEGLPDPGKFLAASRDGSKVLLSNGHLHEIGGEEGTIDLTQGSGGFQGVVGESEDLSSIYFVDTAVLTGEEENGYGAKAQAGQNNLYAWEAGSTAFIATLGTNDSPAWSSFRSSRMGEASPSGGWLTFISHAPITGFGNIGPCAVSGGGETLTIPCPEAFLYDSATGGLVCASCSRSNSRPLGPTVLRVIKGATDSLPQPRYLTDSGRLYFDSQDSLVAADTNGNVEDVYQYEPGGIGSCIRPDGCVSLISGGREAADSNFLTMDSTGDNVFFTTRDRLVPADEDDLIDLYDARVNGGIDRESELPAKGCGDSCLPPTSVEAEPPSSSKISGSGNFKPKPRCKKGKAKRHGRCGKKPGHGKHKRPARHREDSR